MHVRSLTGPDTPPPATEEAVRAAEGALGFPLPPLLRDLYRTVGDGGFGPCYGFLRLGDGQAPPESDDEPEEPEESGAAYLHARFVRHSPLLVFNGQIANGWPAGMLPFCDWGCGIYSCAWCGAPDTPVYVYDWNMPETMALLRHTDSLAEWLTRWAAGADLWAEMRHLAPDWPEPEPREW